MQNLLFELFLLKTRAVVCFWENAKTAFPFHVSRATGVADKQMPRFDSSEPNSPQFFGALLHDFPTYGQNRFHRPPICLHDFG